MSRKLTASDRKNLIRLASTMPKGSPERKAILEGLLNLSDIPPGQVSTNQVRMASAEGHPIRVARRKRANPALARTLVMTCASSPMCRKATARALRFPGSLLDMWFDAVGDLADEAAEGMLTEGQERGFRKLGKVMTTLGRVHFTGLDMLADALESMSNDDAEILSKLAEK